MNSIFNKLDEKFNADQYFSKRRRMPKERDDLGPTLRELVTAERNERAESLFNQIRISDQVCPGVEWSRLLGIFLFLEKEKVEV